MKRPGAGEKILVAVTAFGAVLILAAVVFFSLTGSGFGADILRAAVGFVLGMGAVTVLTRSPRRGGLVAAVVLLVFIVGCLALVLARPGWLVALAEHEPGWAKFTTGLVSSMAGISLVRLFGINPMGPRGDQASGRRV